MQRFRKTKPHPGRKRCVQMGHAMPRQHRCHCPGQPPAAFQPTGTHDLNDTAGQEPARRGQRCQGRANGPARPGPPAAPQPPRPPQPGSRLPGLRPARRAAASRARPDREQRSPLPAPRPRTGTEEDPDPGAAAQPDARAPPAPGTRGPHSLRRRQSPRPCRARRGLRSTARPAARSASMAVPRPSPACTETAGAGPGGAGRAGSGGAPSAAGFGALTSAAAEALGLPGQRGRVRGGPAAARSRPVPSRPGPAPVPLSAPLSARCSCGTYGRC